MGNVTMTSVLGLLALAGQTPGPIPMEWWQAAFWGAVGIFAVDAIEGAKSINANGGQFPEGMRNFGFYFAEGLRLLAAAIFAAAFALSGQVTGPLAALGIGAAAPLIAERISKTMPPGTV